jgi:two-component system cell cycle response regulator PopA
MLITIRAPDARAARALQSKLEAGAIAAVAQIGALGTRMMPEDGAIVLLDGAVANRGWMIDACKEYEASGRRPLALAVAGSNAVAPIFVDAAFDGWIDCDAPHALLQRQCAALLRAAEARAELSLRTKTAASIGLKAPAIEALGAVRLLYIGAPDPFYLELESLSADSGATLDAAFSSFMGFDRLHEARFDAVILKSEPDPATALALCGALRRNARLHHTPTLMVIKPGDEMTKAAAIERGASVTLAQGGDSTAALSWLNESIRAFRRHAGAEIGLNALRLAAGGAGGLFDHGFFAAHLQTLTESATLSGRALSLVALRVALAPGARDVTETLWRRELEQVSALTGRLIRTHDSAALLDDDIIAIAIPGAREAEARATAERVAAVAECTAFAAGQNDAGPVVLGQSVVELAPGESATGLLYRAISAFDDRRLRTGA